MQLTGIVIRKQPLTNGDWFLRVLTKEQGLTTLSLRKPLYLKTPALFEFGIINTFITSESTNPQIYDVVLKKKYHFQAYEHLVAATEIITAISKTLVAGQSNIALYMIVVKSFDLLQKTNPKSDDIIDALILEALRAIIHAEGISTKPELNRAECEQILKQYRGEL